MRLDDAQFNLAEYLRVLQRRKVTILLVTLGLVAAALVASLVQTPVYEGKAEVLLHPREQSVFTSESGSSPPVGTVETELRVLKSDAVRRAVREKLGSLPNVSAARVGETEVMQISALSTMPERAAATANAYASAYVDLRRNQAVSTLLSAGQEVQARIDSIRAEIDRLDRQIAQAPASERTTVDATLRPRYSNLLAQQGVLEQKLDQLQVDTTLRTGGAELVRAAPVPESPVRPKPLRNGFAATAVGLALGVGLAFLREHLDDSVKTKEDLSRAVAGLPVLGVVPVTKRRESEKERVPFTSLRTGTSPAAEAYRGLRTSVQLQGLDRPIRTIEVTSPMPGEGKTTTVANLGAVLATAGQRVVVVDCDLRRPHLHEVFGRSNDVGFTSVLLGDVALRVAIQKVSSDDSLFLLPSGPIPANHSELLSSKRAAELVFELQSKFDLVLLDTAPVLPVTDSIVLAAWVEATLLVARAGVTTRKQLAEAVEQLKQVDARPIGTVLNRADEESSYGYPYGHNGDRPSANRSRPTRGLLGQVMKGRAKAS